MAVVHVRSLASKNPLHLFTCYLAISKKKKIRRMKPGESNRVYCFNLKNQECHNCTENIFSL